MEMGSIFSDEIEKLIFYRFLLLLSKDKNQKPEMQACKERITKRVSLKTLGIVYVAHLCLIGICALGFFSITSPEQREDLRRALIGSQCTSSQDCGNGSCEPDGPSRFACKCDDGYLSVNGVCNYRQKTQVAAFLLSFFFGIIGVDYFYLSTCQPCDCYIGLGFLNIFTGGGVGIWWLVRWIWIAVGTFVDGSGHPLKPW